MQHTSLSNAKIGLLTSKTTKVWTRRRSISWIATWQGVCITMLMPTRYESVGCDEGRFISPEESYQLKVGTKLRLVREADNRHDPNAVAVMYDNKETDEAVLIGYIPGTDNEQLAILLDMGWTHLFECSICQVNPEAHPERQIHLTIKVKRNKEN